MPLCYYTDLVEARIADEIDTTDHGRANIVVVSAFKVTVEEDSLAQPVHGLLMVVVRHGKVRLKGC